MTSTRLILRSLAHYWRTHLGVVAGAAVSTAILVGALAVGDSVRHTLRVLALARLGEVDWALDAGNRFFREKLAAETSHKAAPILRLLATAARGDGAARANGVQVLGVDERFWPLAGPQARPLSLGTDQVALNERLAAQLRVRAGDEVLLRVERPGVLSRDAPLAPTDDATVAMRLTVAAVVSADQLGRFSLQANQVAPYNAFVPLGDLQRKVGKVGRANLLLLAHGVPARLPPFPLGRARLDDLGLELRELPQARVAELRTERVFLDPPVAEAAKAIPGAIGVLTYFVNELRVRDRTTPYSMVTAIGPLGGQGGLPDLTPGVGDGEIVVNPWLAEDLEAKPGDELEMTYYVIGPTRKLIEHKARFRLRAIVPMEGLAADRELMPNFPGLADVDNCRDWKPGIPIDLKKIRKKDEDYWAKHRGTPKAFVTLAAGQRLWASRFGNLTAVRFPLAAGAAEVEKALLERLDPADFGLVFRPVREEALKAATQGTDFGQLFLGLSFFLIAAAVLLMGLLFVFGIEQRSEQVGTLIALGFTPRGVRRLLLAEGGLLALAGGTIGAFAGTLYTRAVLHALATVWSGAVAKSAIEYHAEPATLLLGGAAGVAVAILAMWLTLRKQAKRPPRELLAGAAGIPAAPAHRLRPSSSSLVLDSSSPQGARKRRRASLWLALAAVLAGLAIVVAMGPRRDQAAAMGFFAAGALLLIGGIALCHGFLSPPIPHHSSLFQGEGRMRVTQRADPPPAPSPKGRGGRVTLRGLSWRNATRRRGRSLAVVALLAAATFLVIAVGANRQDPMAEWRSGRSPLHPLHGELYGETALPVFEDLSTEAGRKALNLDPETMRHVTVTPLRLREGDDASCLNLNRAQQPRLLGARPAALLNRGIFTFVRTLRGLDADKRWLLLDERLPDGAVPAIGDEATVVWGLGKSLGDTLTYTDDRGRQFQVRIVAIIANSILQGSLVISEEHFVRRFPSAEGYRVFLIKVPAGFDVHARLVWQGAAARDELSRALADAGLELSPTIKRLAEFSVVENTYLSIFQALGGLGLLLGSVGLGVVVLRNVLERRSELALLRAVGFHRRSLHWLLLGEHWGLLALGLLVGTASAIVAVLPALRAPGAEVPYFSLSLTLLGVAASGLAWTWLAAAAALRGPLLPALREE